jgi:hypothetical protein
MLTSSSSRKLRPSNFSIALLAEAGRSRLGYIPPFFPVQTGHKTDYGRVAKKERGTTMGEAILTGQNLVPLLSQ